MVHPRRSITLVPAARRPANTLPATHPAIVVTPRNNLPVSLTRFIGRDREVTEIIALLATTRLLTLTGTGGCGKTRLTLTVGNRTLAAYPDGVWFAAFATLADPNLVPQAVAAALGVREEGGRPTEEALIEALRDRSLLLIFDNCEHVIAACATLADRLLRTCPNIQILATSREPLRVGGEMTWRVPSLTLPEPDHVTTATKLMESEAVQLFVDRARSRLPMFDLTDANAAAVTEICRQLNGMPLALELAAGCITALGVSQLATRLDDALRLLTTGERTAAPRHQTLRAALDWSYDLLSADERIVLERLAIFAGGCDLEAAEAVCADAEIAHAEIVPLLAQLVEKSLVQMDERDGRARYWLLETVRQYAHMWLETNGEVARVRQRHADWFLALAVQASPGLNGTAMGTWLERLEIEHDNLRAALRWSLEQEQITAGLQIGASIYLFWYARGYLREGRGWLDTLLARTHVVPLSPTDMTTAIFVKYCAGRLAMYQGDYAAADALLQEALAAARDVQHTRYIGYTLTQLGHLALFQGDFTAARAHYTEGLNIRQARGDREGVAIMTGSLGRVAFYERDLAAARALLEACLATFRAMEVNTETISVLCDLGQIAVEQGDLDIAATYFREGLTLCQQRSIRQCIPQCLEGFAAVSAAHGEPERAVRLASAAAVLRSAITAPLPPIVQDRLRQSLAPARQALGERAGVAETAGAVMPFDAVIEEAMSATIPDTRANEDNASDQSLTNDRRTAKQQYGGLTQREREVITAVAQGHSNREIADALYVSEKTIEWHVGNCLRKRGFRTRAELAVWAVAAGLLPSPPPSRDVTDGKD